MDHRALANDVADFQVSQCSASYSGGVERHQQSAMEGSAGRLNELSNFFLAEDRWQVMGRTATLLGDNLCFSNCSA
jgi:hypothetical protein